MRRQAPSTGSALSGISMMGFALSTMLVIALVWTAAAHAQRPSADQYKKLKVNEMLKDPARSDPEASDVSVSEDKTGGEPPSAKAETSGSEPLRGKADPEGGKSRVVGLRSGVLPATGGPMLLMLGVGGALAVSGAGLMLLHRRYGRGR